MALRWYVAETERSMEGTAAKQLQAQEFEVFHPCSDIRRVVRGRVCTRSVPFWPGYLLVRFDADKPGWQRVNGTRGVRRRRGSGIICTGEKPLPLRDRLVEQLQEWCGRQASIDLAEAMRFVVKVGEDARIRVGAWAGFIGVCEWTDGVRVKLLLSLFGRPTSVEFDARDVEAV